MHQQEKWQYSFVDLVEIPQIRELLEAHYQVTGIGAGILGTDESILVAVGCQDICTRFHRANPLSSERCRASDSYIKAHLSECNGGHLEYRCKNGLVDVAVPIIIRGEHLATFFTGQFFYDDDKPDPEYFRKQAEKFGFDETGYLEALGRVPKLSRDLVQRITEYNRNLVRVIAEMGLKNLELRNEAAKRNLYEEELLLCRFCIEKAGVGIYRTVEDGTIFSVNDYACTSLGYSKDELCALNVFDIDPIITREKISEIRKLLEASGSVTHETIHRRKDGTTFPVEITANLLNCHGKAFRISFVKEITERKLAEEALKRLNEELENRFAERTKELAFKNAILSTQYETSIDGILLVGENDTIISYNRRFVDMWDIPPELMGARDDTLVLQMVADWAADPELFLTRVKNIYELKEEKCREDIILKDGRVFDRYSAPVRGDDGKYFGRVWYFRDITERKRMVEALRNSESVLSKMFDSIPDLLSVIDRNLRIVRSNWHGGYEYVDHDIRDNSPLCYEAYYPGQDKPCEVCHTIEVFRTGKPVVVEKFNPRIGLMEVHAYPVFDDAGKVIMVVEHIRDVTVRKHAIEALRNARDELEARVRERTEQLTSLTAELSLAEERERRRIATELHDQVGQALIFSKIRLDSLSHGLSQESFSNLVGEISEYLNRSIDDIRSLTFQLSPPLLYEVGFEAAVEWLGEEFQEKHGFQVEFEDDGSKKPLDEEASVALYQMVRELLANAARHAKAKKVWISVGNVSGKIKISVADDGIGFANLNGMLRKDKRNGFGLFNIRQRIEYLGGEFLIKSEIGQGTRATLLFPLKKRKMERKIQ